MVVALARLAHVDSIERLAAWSEESIATLVTVDAGGVVLTVDTHPTATVLAMDVHTGVVGKHLRIEETLLRVSMTVALLAHKWVGHGGTTPLVLLVSIATLLAL